MIIASHIRRSLAFIFIVFAASTTVIAEVDNPGGGSPIVIPAAAFSTDGIDLDQYLVWDGYLYGAGSRNITLRAAAPLPHGSAVNFFGAMLVDDDDGADVTISLYRVEIGGWSAEQIAMVSTAGSSSSFQRPMVALSHEVDAARYAYWVEVYGRLSPETKLYAAWISVTQSSLIFIDDFESGDLSYWSSSNALKRLTRGHHEPHSTGYRNDSSFETVEWLDEQGFGAEVDALLKNESPESYGSPLVLPGSAFKPMGGMWYDDYYIDGMFGWIRGGVGDHETLMVAPVNLPDGVEVSMVMLFYLDDDPSSEIYAYLVRTAADTGETDTMATIATSGAGSSATSIIDSTVEHSLINNDEYTYFARIGLSSLNHRMFGLAILYTTPD